MYSCADYSHSYLTERPSAVFLTNTSGILCTLKLGCERWVKEVNTAKETLGVIREYKRNHEKMTLMSREQIFEEGEVSCYIAGRIK